MDEKAREEFLRKRQERMGQVIPQTQPVNEPAPEPTTENSTVSDGTGTGSPKVWMARQSYHVWLNPTDIEFLERYIYWRGVAANKKWTVSDALTDAIRMLQKHTPVEVKPIPEWVPRRRKRKVSTETQNKD